MAPTGQDTPQPRNSHGRRGAVCFVAASSRVAFVRLAHCLCSTCTTVSIFSTPNVYNIPLLRSLVPVVLTAVPDLTPPSNKFKGGDSFPGGFGGDHGYGRGGGEHAGRAGSVG